MKHIAAHLEDTIRQALPLLQSMSDEQASAKPAPGKWSPKEIIGHLIDSAGNNQQKFVRCMEQDGVHFSRLCAGLLGGHPSLQQCSVAATRRFVGAL